MSWIKRNLYFLVASVVAVIMLIGSGLYLYASWQLKNSSLETLTRATTEWKSILEKPNGPGNEKINNIETAREQQRKVRERIREIHKNFVPIPRIPDPAEVAARKEDMASAVRSALRRTIDQLQHDAANNSVTLPMQNYAFSFKAQQNQYNFPPGSLEPLSVQLGEVKAICDVLFRAKINSLDGLQRERVSTDDFQNGPPSEYVDPTHTSVTNDLAVLAPYVVTMRCFSPELASVLSGFANNPHGFIVKAINVEPGTGAGPMTTDASGNLVPSLSSTPYGQPYAQPGYPPPGYPDRYGGSPGMIPGAPPAAAPTTTPRGGLPTVLDEKQLKVTLVLNVVRLHPKR
jgi:hypothetical protein